MSTNSSITDLIEDAGRMLGFAVPRTPLAEAHEAVARCLAQLKRLEWESAYLIPRGELSEKDHR